MFVAGTAKTNEATRQHSQGPEQSPMTTLKVIHNGGFFSCCSIRLAEIVAYYNERGTLPDAVDSSEQFSAYKSNHTDDITPLLFKENAVDINVDTGIFFESDCQYASYDNLDHRRIAPFINKYFCLSDEVNDAVEAFIAKYDISPENTLATFYRGNDKVKETPIGSYEVFLRKLNDLMALNPGMSVLIQSDEQDFIDYCRIHSSKARTIVIDEVGRIPRNLKAAVHHGLTTDRERFAVSFLAATRVVSLCRLVITHSGNCGMWASLLRGSNENVYQYLNTKFIR